MSRVTQFDLDDFFSVPQNYQEGCHAYYAHLGDNIGIKIGKPGIAEADRVDLRIYREFVILKGIETSGLAPEAYCHGVVRMTHPKTRKQILAPYILLEHLRGTSPVDIQELIVNEHYSRSPDFQPQSSYEARLAWAYSHDEFSGHRAQYERIMRIMRNYELQMKDHEENLDNFIIKEGLWKVIDFSCENLKHMSPKRKAQMMHRAEPFLNQALPPKWMHRTLRDFLVQI